MIKYRLIIIFLTAPVLTGYCQNKMHFVKGCVFIDKNKNGVRDSGEKPVSRVYLSNGIDFVQTKKNGNYKIKAKTGQSVFPVLPSGYTFGKRNHWWYKLSENNEQKKIKVDFGLLPQEVKNKFSVLIIGDIQVGNQDEMFYAAGSILSELKSRNDYDFSIFLGDMVNDEPALMAPLNQMITQLSRPAFMVYGNHDRNFEEPLSKQEKDFTEIFGPTHYAFFRNNILFIALNSIMPVGKYGYKGVYPDSQLKFLANLLKLVPKDQFLVISQHIPLRMMENEEELLELLKERKKVLVFSGHMHTISQDFRKTENGLSIHELTAGAVSGYWWTGEKNAKGIPLALMQDGSPRGYFKVDFMGNNDYTLKFKAVGLPATEQLSLWFGKEGINPALIIDAKNRDVLVNVYAGSEKTKVKLRVDGGEWMILERNRVLDRFVQRIKQLQKKGLYPNKISRSSPYRSRPSTHIWTVRLPLNLEQGIHQLEITAKDDYGLNHREFAWFWVSEF